MFRHLFWIFSLFNTINLQQSIIFFFFFQPLFFFSSFSFDLFNLFVHLGLATGCRLFDKVEFGVGPIETTALLVMQMWLIGAGQKHLEKLLLIGLMLLQLSENVVIHLVLLA